MTRSADVMTRGAPAMSPGGAAGIVDVARVPVRISEPCEAEC